MVHFWTLRRRLLSGLAASVSGLAANTNALSADTASRPPVARREPRVVKFGVVPGEDRGPNPMDPPKTLVDDLFWLRDDKRESPEVLDLLRAENAYTEAKSRHLASAREALYAELLSHVKEDDEGVPCSAGDGYEYSWRTLEGKPFRQYVRRRVGSTESHVYLDVNVVASELCAKPSMCVVSEVEVSPSGAKVAFTLDESGYETYDIRLRDLDGKGPKDDEVLKNTAGSVCWGDESTVYYVEHDAAHRPYRCLRHVLGRPQAEDEVLFEEPDERFNVACWRELDGSLVAIESESKETTEVRIVATKGKAAPKVVRPREEGVQYSIASHAPSGQIFVASNARGNVNRALYAASVANPDRWRQVVSHSTTRSLTGGIVAFRDFVAIAGREHGFSQVWTLDLTRNDETLDPVFDDDAAAAVGIGANRDFQSSKLRVTYSSMTKPQEVLDCVVRDRTFQTLKIQPVPNYDPELYSTKRVECVAKDGTAIPITLLWRPDKVDGTKVHLYGYGSYGISIDPSFAASRLPLVDRGVVYALAHVRGGGEGGKWAWYESAGKYLTKRNTFDDFVACANKIKTDLYPGCQVSIEGRSAGGLLVGNACNMAPDLFNACVAGVPFVDLMTTMCDPSIPLTTGARILRIVGSFFGLEPPLAAEEWCEWGNPNEAEYFDYMLSYSPINQVRKGATYPSMLIVSGLNDPRVAYWVRRIPPRNDAALTPPPRQEPTKWAQVLRANIKNGDDVLLKMDLDAGHFSASDRYRYLRELAFDYAWLLDQHGVLGGK